MKKTTYLILSLLFAFCYHQSFSQNYNKLLAGSTSPITGFVNSTIAAGGVGELIPIDYDVDGDIDLLTLNSAINGWHLLRNSGGVFTEETSTMVGLGIADAQNFIVMDYDNDGDDDIIDPIAGLSSEADVYRNDGGGVFVKLSAGSTSPITGFVNSTIAAGGVGELIPIDYDVDGDIDLLTLNSAINGWHLLRNSGGVFTEETSTMVGLGIADAQNFIVMDYDNDGDDDIIDPIAGLSSEADVYQNNNAPPKISSSSPSDGATDFEASSNIVITFNEPITKGSGVIEIRKVSDNSVVESINVSSTTVLGAVLTINPVNDLIIATDLYIHISAGAILDAENEIVVSLNNNPKTLNFVAENTLGDDQPLLENSISLYPNPVKNELNIKTNAIEIQQAILYDILGKSIKHINVENEVVDLSKIFNGIHLLKLVTDKGVLVKKITKQ